MSTRKAILETQETLLTQEYGERTGIIAENRVAII
jgi:hypothetical protein